MSTSDYHNTPEAVKTSDLTILGHNYTVAQITSRCWVVTSRKTGRTWQVEGYAGMLIWREKATEWIEAQPVTVRQEAHTAACETPAEFIVRISEDQDIPDDELTPVARFQRMMARNDSAAMTARALGDVIANEVETVNRKLEAK